MASIIEKKNGSYLIRVSLGRIGGKEKKTSIIFKPDTHTGSGRAKAKSVIRGEVEKAAYEFEKRVKEGQYSLGAAKDYTFERYMTEVWLENYGSQKLSQRVKEDYLSVMRIHVVPYIGGFRINAITADHIQEIINKAIKEGRAPATVRKIFTICNSVFAYARRHRVISSNPCDREIVDLPAVTCSGIGPGPDEKQQIFTVDQTRRFLEYCKKPYKVIVNRKSGPYEQTKTVPLQMQAFFHLAFYLGARRGELCAVRWNDIDWNNSTIRINKSVSVTKEDGQIEKAPKTKNSVRVLVMTTSCKEILNKWRVEAIKRSLAGGGEWLGYKGAEFDNNYVFIQDNGRQIDLSTPYQSMKRAIARYNKAAGEKNALPNIRLHDARHTAASSQIALGVSIADASRNLGHANVSTTARIYLHGQEDSARRVAEVLERALG